MSVVRFAVYSLLTLIVVAFACQVSHAELVAHWPLREIDGSVFADLVAGNHGFVPDGATVGGVDDGPLGVAESSVLFTGDNGPSFIETPFAGIGGFDARTISAGEIDPQWFV